MRTMIDIVWHALELRLPSASEAVRWLRTVRRRNVATALIFAAMAGPLATERVSAAGPGDNGPELRLQLARSDAGQPDRSGHVAAF